ncbi:hypothetical protein PF011_g29061 [Phytophthora fragariae]|uniref:Uncharacterized protein n=2 Tax=Phytophthora fragariae TaxID=53985 RepID=A0A6A3H228_9STRA|nr:hypothetical protein PF011_g29061 [Phytophthora fragariae]
MVKRDRHHVLDVGFRCGLGKKRRRRASAHDETVDDEEGDEGEEGEEVDGDGGQQGVQWEEIRQVTTWQAVRKTWAFGAC